MKQVRTNRLKRSLLGRFDGQIEGLPRVDTITSGHVDLAKSDERPHTTELVTNRGGRRHGRLVLPRLRLPARQCRPRFRMGQMQKPQRSRCTLEVTRLGSVDSNLSPVAVPIITGEPVCGNDRVIERAHGSVAVSDLRPGPSDGAIGKDCPRRAPERRQ